MTDRFLCIHGHFYQPPRENPWLEAIEVQDSADPYHDWNARIEAECYGQNGRSRILDDRGRIARIVNNYSRMSFNFGPTLLSWLEDEAPATYRSILDADRASLERFSGHGSALAQAYGHMILPLSNRRDKETQILWGLRDFESRFGRKPEGMWLPETAVDVETLELLHRHGILFTILSPEQAGRVRKRGSRQWTDVSDHSIDPSRAYEQALPSGGSIALFFYDSPISRAVAFEGLLASSNLFVDRLVGGFSGQRKGPQLVHIATDGESYGHHHRHGDMALAAALETLEQDASIRLTNYGEFLDLHPPEYEVEIRENTSWSCAHGVERWRSDCGCSGGRGDNWNQAWRKPLREALDRLRDGLAPRYEQMGGEVFHDPWKARDEYIDVVLDRTEDSVRSFLGRHCRDDAAPVEEVTPLKLLELQRHAMLMYTSCGWFFDDISGIETVQVIQYAGRAVQLAGELFGDPLEEGFLECLEEARSNVSEHGDGRRIYEKWVAPMAVDMKRLAAHYAVSSLFEDYDETTEIYCYDVRALESEQYESGYLRMRLGKVDAHSRVTRERALLDFAAVHFGSHSVAGGTVQASSDSPATERFAHLVESLRGAHIPELAHQIGELFGDDAFSLRELFRDEQRSILDSILTETVQAADDVYLNVYQQNAGLMQFLGEQGMRVPRALSMAAERAVNHQLEIALDPEDVLDRDRIEELLREARARQIELDRTHLEYRIRSRLEKLAEALVADPDDLDRLRRLETAADLIGLLPFHVDVWRIQNDYYRIQVERLPAHAARAEGGDAGSREWTERFRRLGDVLGMAPTA